MDSSYESKVINLLKKKGSLMDQEESPAFLLSVILEEFLYEYENDSRYRKEVALAKRLNDFLLNDDHLYYFDA